MILCTVMGKKMKYAGIIKEPRLTLFKELLELSEKIRELINISNMKPEFYSIETFQKIMSLEESRGRLKDFCYSTETKSLSQEIRDLRNELRKQPKDQREVIQQQLEDLTNLYEERKWSEIAEVYNQVVHGKYCVQLNAGDKGQVPLSPWGINLDFTEVFEEYRKKRAEKVCEAYADGSLYGYFYAQSMAETTEELINGLKKRFRHWLRAYNPLH